MNSADVSSFVDRLARNEVLYDEFQDFEAADWEAVKGYLLDHKMVRLQRHINAVHLIKTKAKPMWARSRPKRSYSEKEILAEFGTKNEE